MGNELVSTVIPVFNRTDWVAETLQSVLCQTWPHVEVLLCDDGSAADVAEKIDRLARRSPESIHVLHLPHRGAGPAREAGRQAARGEFIQYLDSDDRLHPEKFARQIAALRAYPECGIAYGRTRLINQDGQVLEESYKNIRQREFLFPGLLVDRWWCTHTPLYRSEVCDLIGPWSDLRYSQDWEYDARAGARSIRLVFVDHVVSDHRTHHAPVRQTGRGRWLAPADQIRFFESLHSCAFAAGIRRDCPEMGHFVRWVFAAARAAGCAGDDVSAKTLLNLARRAYGKTSMEMALYGLAGRSFGWRAAGSVAERVQRLLRRKRGSHTLPQCWVKEGE